MSNARKSIGSGLARAGNFLASSGRAAVIRLGEFAANAWGRLGGFATQAGTSVMNGLNTAGSAVAKGAEKASSWLDGLRRRWEKRPARH